MEYQYFNLQDVDPTFRPIDQGVYTLQLAKIAGQVKVPKSGKMAGQETLMINGTFIVTGDPTFSGRRLFNTFWIHNPYDQKALRKISDRTGVIQNPGESLEDYFARLTQIQPSFKAKVDVVKEPDQTGEVVDVNKIDFRSVAAV
jgi:hypothetical protein